MADKLFKELTLKSTQSLEKSDKWIVGLTVLCAVLLFSWLVYDIAFLNPLLEGQVPVGKIYEAQNRVKRKFNKSLIWYPAENNEIVYENDWIFTGSMSIAKIKLDSGGEIVIEPDSLIILSRKNGILQLNLQHGRLMADVKSKDISINVLRDGKLQKIDTQKGAIQISQDDSDKVDEILDLDSDDNGDDDISLSELADRKFYEAKSGFSDLDEMGLSYKIENDFEFQLYEGQKGDVVFDWIDPYGKWTSFEAEASEEANFKNIISNYSGLNSEFIFPTDQSGPLYWRVRGVDKNGKKSNWSERLTVNVSVEFLEKGEPLELSRNSMLYQLDKNDLQNVKADNSYDVTDDKPVEISWKALEKASSYKVQISGKEDFSDILEEKIVKNNSLKLTNIKIGQTHFRVVPENEQGVSIAKAAKGKVMT